MQISEKSPPLPESMTFGKWLSLAKLVQRSSFYRRRIEWRTLFGCWTGIGLLTAAFFWTETRLPPVSPCMLAAAYTVFFVCVTVMLTTLQFSNAGDRDYLYYYIDKALAIDTDAAESMRKKQRPSFPGPRKLNWVNYAWLLGQLGVTAVMLWMSWYLITLPGTKVPS